MIAISKLTEKDLAFFKGKKVFLCSAKPDPTLLYETFKFLNIEVVGYSILDKTMQPTVKRLVKNKIQGLSYVKPSDLNVFFAQQDLRNFIVQPVVNTKEHFEQVNFVLSQSNIKKSNVSSGEIIASFSFLFQTSKFKSTAKFIHKKTKHFFTSASTVAPAVKSIWKQFCADEHKNTIVICSPPKTADYTLNYTFDCLIKNTPASDNLNSMFQYINLWHYPNCVNHAKIEKSGEKLKLLMGLREPISQNLSWMFHELSGNANLASLINRELFETYPLPNRKQLIKKYESVFQNGIDVQSYWDIYISFYTNKNSNSKKIRYRVGLIQDFILALTKHVVDLTAFSFDKEKGYTIIKEGNIEVFVYQLEKLNNLVPELSEWVGVPFDKLEKGNAAEDKWIAESYKQAQKEIEITQEYFDKCFDEPYVKHCYSEADIEKFKARWRPHIKKEA